jgi:hypothetical protein
VQFRRPITSTFMPPGPDLRKQLPRSNSEGPKRTQNKVGATNKCQTAGSRSACAPATERTSLNGGDRTNPSAPTTARQRHECVGKRMLSYDAG